MLVDFGYLLLLVLILAGFIDAGERSGEYHPGHGKPFGDPAASPRLHVVERKGFVPVIEFFNDFVRTSTPVLMRGAYKDAPAFTLWDDDYFRTVHEPEESKVNVETSKKEDRTQEIFTMPFKKFVSIYMNESVYMVDPVPKHIQRDASVPGSLQCPSILPHFVTNIMWMSSGGTKSVVHNDDMENLNCLVRGKKELVFVDPNKFPDTVPLDKSQGSFSSLDVDSVDYKKYPTMANVGEFYFANMSSGDCLFIPYKWVHQVRSFERNIAVNIWWYKEGSKPIDLDACKEFVHFDPLFTLADIPWKEDKEEERDLSQDIEAELEESGELEKKFWWTVLSTDAYSDTPLFRDAPETAKRAKQIYDKLFALLDANDDGKLSREEYDALDEEKRKPIEKQMENLDEILAERGAAERKAAQKSDRGSDKSEL